MFESLLSYAHTIINEFISVEALIGKVACNRIHCKKIRSTALPRALDATGAAGILILILATTNASQTLHTACSLNGVFDSTAILSQSNAAQNEIDNRGKQN